MLGAQIDTRSGRNPLVSDTGVAPHLLQLYRDRCSLIHSNSLGRLSVKEDAFPAYFYALSPSSSPSDPPSDRPSSSLPLPA